MNAPKRWYHRTLTGVMLGLATAGMPAIAPQPAYPDPIQPLALDTDQLLQQGVEQYNHRQVAAAIASWQQALTRYRQEQNRSGEGLALQYLGVAFETQGDYRQAIAFYQLQRDWARQSNNRLVEANALGSLGNASQLLGQYNQATRFYQEALLRFRELGEVKSVGQVLSNLGNLQATLGNYDEAIAYQQESLQISQRLGNHRATVLAVHSLGAYYAAQANYPLAQRYYEQGLQAARQIQFQSAEANVLNSLGTLAHAQRNFRGAIAYYQQALAIATATQDRRLQATTQGGLGLALTNLGQYPQALDYQQQAIRQAQQLQDRLLEANLQNNLSYTWAKSGDLDRAEQAIRQALMRLESLRSNLSDADKISIFDTQARSYNTLQRLLVAKRQPEAALVAAERGRARAFVELLSQRLSTSGQIATNPVLPPTLAELRQIARTQQATLVEYSIIPDEDFIAQGKLIGPDTQLFIWVVQPNGEISFRRQDLTQLQTSIVELVTLGRAAIGVRGLTFEENLAVTTEVAASSVRNAKLQQLHQILIEPIADLLPRRPEQRLILIPQGPLFMVPFAALQDSAGQYLIQKHTLLTAPAMQVLGLTHQQAQRVQQRGSKGALVVGNPTMPKLALDGKTWRQLTNLPGAEAEARTIAALLNTQALLGDQATKAAVRQQMPNVKLIHLATHGLLNRLDASGQINRFGVPGAIALAPSASDSGLLTSSEILQLRLNADLVVLSACDTGRGDLTGDGVIGLSRALIAAGAASVVVSLWQVPDAPTEFLMVQFYRHLPGLGKARALRQAMLETMQVYPDPKDWAAFTLIGEPE